MPFDFDRAVAFVRERGDELDHARLDLLVDNGPLLSPEQWKRLLAGQRPDGGWAPFWAHDYSSIDATCFRFAQAESSSRADSVGSNLAALTCEGGMR